MFLKEFEPVVNEVIPVALPEVHHGRALKAQQKSSRKQMKKDRNRAKNSKTAQKPSI